MKKFFLILLISTYSFASTNAAVYIHYCCGWVESISFEDSVPSPAAEESCHAPVKEVKKTNDCCQDKTVELDKVSDHSFSAVFDQSFKLFPILLPGFSSVGQNILHSFNDVPVQNNNSPPALVTAPVYILNCTFRI